MIDQSFELAKIHQQELLRTAEHVRMLKAINRNRISRASLRDRFLASLGTALIRGGVRLRARRKAGDECAKPAVVILKCSA